MHESLSTSRRCRAMYGVLVDRENRKTWPRSQFLAQLRSPSSSKSKQQPWGVILSNFPLVAPQFVSHSCRCRPFTTLYSVG